MLKISESLFDFEEVGQVSSEKVKKLAARMLAGYRRRESEKATLIEATATSPKARTTE